MNVMLLTDLKAALKALMSFLALAVGALAGAAMAGLLNISPASVSFLTAVGGFLATFGFRPLMVSVETAQKLGYLSLLIAASQTIHGGWMSALTLTHPHVLLVFHLVGLAGIVMGWLGRNPVPSNAKYAAKLDRPPTDDNP